MTWQCSLVAINHAQRGHQITVVSPFKPTKLIPNVEEIVLTGATDLIEENGFNWFEIQSRSPLVQLSSLLYEARHMFQHTYAELMANERVQQIIKERQVDLVFSDGFFNEMVYPIIDHLGVTFVFYCSMPNLGRLYRTIKAYDDYASVPVGLTDSDEQMSFLERLGNVLSLEGFGLVQDFTIISMLDELVHKDFPNTRPISEIVKDVSLIMVNSHPFIAWTRSLPPSVIPVSYLHTRPAQPLSEVLNLKINKFYLIFQNKTHCTAFQNVCGRSEKWSHYFCFRLGHQIVVHAGRDPSNFPPSA